MSLLDLVVDFIFSYELFGGIYTALIYLNGSMKYQTSIILDVLTVVLREYFF